MREELFPTEHVLPEETGSETRPDLRQRMFVDREMYRLPGDHPLTENDIDRYVKSNADLRQIQPQLIERGFSDGDTLVRQRAVELFNLATEAERAKLQEQLVGIIEQGLGHHDNNVWEQAAKLIGLAPEADRVRLIEQGLGHHDNNVREQAAKLIGLAPEADRVRLIEQGLGHHDNNVREQAAKLIGLAPEADRVRLLEQGRYDDNVFVRIAAWKLIGLAPEADRPRLQQQLVGVIEQHLDDDIASVRGEAVKLVHLAPEAERAKFIERGLRDDDAYVREQATKLIGLAPEDEHVRLIERGLRDEDAYVREQAAKLIDLAPEENRPRLQEQLVGIIEQGLGNSDPDVRKRAVRLIDLAPAADRARLVEAAISLNPDIRTHAESTPLYNQYTRRFFRGKFEKSGSGTTLLDAVPGQTERSLRERVIIRHIDPGAYFSWREAYENSLAWKEAGFDYVPIEPIVKAEIQQDLTVDVFTRVLRGPSLMIWGNRAGLYVNEINKQIDAITDVLDKLGIEHGHPHNGNFVVVFDRDPKGAIILDKPPRVYAIDFDKARSGSK